MGQISNKLYDYNEAKIGNFILLGTYDLATKTIEFVEDSDSDSDSDSEEEE